MKVLFHIPSVETVYAMRSIYHGFKNAFNYSGDVFKTLDQNVNFETILNEFKPDLFITSSHYWYRKQIDFKILNIFRKKGMFVLVKVDFWNSPFSKFKINEAKALKDDYDLINLIKKDNFGDAYYHNVEQNDKRMDGFCEGTGRNFYTIPLACDSFIFNDLRKESLDRLREIGFDGYALGGLAVGEKQNEMFEVLDNISQFLPKNKPHYLMGVGTPSDLLGAVKRGIDMFDCVLPTRSGRTGLAYTWEGKKNLRNAKYATDDEPLDPKVNCPASQNYSRSYLNHLTNSNEILGSILLTWHNIAFYQDLMKKIRESIADNNFENFYRKHFEILNS